MRAKIKVGYLWKAPGSRGLTLKSTFSNNSTVIIRYCIVIQALCSVCLLNFIFSHLLF